MDTALQTAIVAVVVLAAAVHAVSRLVPRLRAALLERAGAAVDRPGRPVWLRRYAARVASDAAANCGSGCGACSACHVGAGRAQAAKQADRARDAD